MSGNKAILDSNVIKFASKETIDVETLFSRYDEFYFPIITYMEVYAYDFPTSDEKDLIDEIFANLKIIEAGKEIADQALSTAKPKR